MHPWHATPKAQAILARLTPADVSLHFERYPIVGPAYFYLAAPEAIELQLRRLREQAVDKAAGYTWASAQLPYDKQRTRAWLDLLGTTPTIHAALAEMFGDPNAWGPNADPAKVRYGWRVLAEQAAEKARAA